MGFRLIAGAGVSDAGTRAAVNDALRVEQNAEVLGAALSAVDSAVLPPSEQNALVRDISGVLAHPDDEVRRLGVEALGTLGRDPAAAGPVFDALADPSAAVRAAAVRALGGISSDPDRARGALVDRITDQAEDWQVRVQAWRALENFPMNEADYETWLRFRDEWEAATEATGG